MSKASLWMSTITMIKVQQKMISSKTIINLGSLSTRIFICMKGILMARWRMNCLLERESIQLFWNSLKCISRTRGKEFSISRLAARLSFKTLMSSKSLAESTLLMRSILKSKWRAMDCIMQVLESPRVWKIIKSNWPLQREKLTTQLYRPLLCIKIQLQIRQRLNSNC